MYFSVDQTILSSRLAQIKCFIASPTQSILIKADSTNDTISISTVNKKSSCRIVFPAVCITTGGTYSIVYDLFSKIIKTYSSDKVIFIRTNTASKMDISTDISFPSYSTLTLSSSPPSVTSVPSLGSPTKLLYVNTVSKKELNTIFDSVRALGADSINIERLGDYCYFTTISTKGCVRSFIKSKTGTLTSRIINSRISIPMDVLNMLPDSEDDISIYSNGTQVIFDAKVWIVHSCTLIASTIDVDKLFVDSNNPRVTPDINLSKRDILPILQRAALIIDTNSNVSIPKYITFDVKQDELSTFVYGVRGEYIDKIVCTSSGVSGPITLSIEWLISVLAATQSNEVSIQLINNGAVVSDNYSPSMLNSNVPADTIVTRSLMSLMNTPKISVQDDDQDLQPEDFAKDSIAV